MLAQRIQGLIQGVRPARFVARGEAHHRGPQREPVRRFGAGFGLDNPHFRPFRYQPRHLFFQQRPHPSGVVGLPVRVSRLGGLVFWAFPCSGGRLGRSGPHSLRSGRDGRRYTEMTDVRRGDAKHVRLPGITGGQPADEIVRVEVKGIAAPEPQRVVALGARPAARRVEGPLKRVPLAEQPVAAGRGLGQPGRGPPGFGFQRGKVALEARGQLVIVARDRRAAGLVVVVVLDVADALQDDPGGGDVVDEAAFDFIAGRLGATPALEEPPASAFLGVGEPDRLGRQAVPGGVLAHARLAGRGLRAGRFLGITAIRVDLGGTDRHGWPAPETVTPTGVRLVRHHRLRGRLLSGNPGPSWKDLVGCVKRTFFLPQKDLVRFTHPTRSRCSPCLCGEEGPRRPSPATRRSPRAGTSLPRGSGCGIGMHWAAGAAACPG